MLPTTARAAPRDLRPLLPPIVAGLAALVVYALTLPPGLTWANHAADGGDLLAAALTGGVPHPTGYPTYQLLLRAVIALAPANPARAGAWFSAVCAALAVALLASLARRQLKGAAVGGRLSRDLATTLAAFGWGVAPLVWGQATVVEVYALHALFCVALLWLARRWLDLAASGAELGPWPVLTGLVFGLGLGNHVTLALMAPGLAILAWSERRGLAPGWARQVAPAVLAAAAGLLVYLYLPLAAGSGSPVNWGDPDTPGRLMWVATGRIYAPLPFSASLPAVAKRLYDLAVLLVETFSPWGLILALAGLWRLDRRMRPWWRATLVIFLTYAVYAAGYRSSDSLIYLIPALAMLALWLAEGLHRAFTVAQQHRLAYVAVVALAVAALPVASLVDNWRAQDLSRDTRAEEFVASALAEAEPDAVLLVLQDEAAFSLWYGVYGLRRRPDVAVVAVSLYGFDWYRRSLADNHPDLLPSVDAPERMTDAIARWVAARPVYLAEDIALPLQLAERPPGAVLTRVLGLEP